MFVCLYVCMFVCLYVRQHMLQVYGQNSVNFYWNVCAAFQWVHRPDKCTNLHETFLFPQKVEIGSAQRIRGFCIWISFPVLPRHHKIYNSTLFASEAGYSIHTHPNFPAYLRPEDNQRWFIPEDSQSWVKAKPCKKSVFGKSWWVINWAKIWNWFDQTRAEVLVMDEQTRGYLRFFWFILDNHIIYLIILFHWWIQI